MEEEGKEGEEEGGGTVVDKVDEKKSPDHEAGRVSLPSFSLPL